MNRLAGPYGTGASFVLVSALLHFGAILIGGITALTMAFILIGLFYLALVAGLTRGWRWLAYVTFFVVCLSGCAALGQLWSASGVPGWWLILIIAMDWLAAMALFVALWRPSPEAPQA